MEMTNTARRATAIHEAAHAAVAFVFGLRLVEVRIIDDSHGEALPECPVCRTCIAYYEKHRPKDDEHSRQIQADLRKQAVVAVAGEVAEQEILGAVSDVEELEQDRLLARSRASVIHLWLESDCYRKGKWMTDECASCRDYIASLHACVQDIVRTLVVRAGIEALATRLERDGSLSGVESANLLRDAGIATLPLSKIPVAPEG